MSSNNNGIHISGNQGDVIGIGIQGDANIVGKNNTVGGNIMNNVTISGDGTVIGNNNNVITTVHKGLSNGILKELGESLALLRGEVIQSDKIAQKDKKQATNAIEDVEEEVSDKNPNPNRIAKRLQDFKEIMETSGQAYDSVSGWGKRLSDAANILKKIVPVVAPLITQFFT